jgi:5-carboxymethyl-2-hydroxymuconate isomerase
MAKGSLNRRGTTLRRGAIPVQIRRNASDRRAGTAPAPEKGNHVPHIVIECSANVRARADIPALLERAHAAALSTGIFPEGGIRTRLAERNDYIIADGDPANAFVHVVLRIRQGRDVATRRRAAETVFAAVCESLDATFHIAPLAISLEIQEIDSETSFKKNNLHEYVERRKAAHA